MANLDEIKSKEPDSRLTSLVTTFRPGSKKILLPTSKYSKDNPSTDEKSCSIVDHDAFDKREPNNKNIDPLTDNNSIVCDYSAIQNNQLVDIKEPYSENKIDENLTVTKQYRNGNETVTKRYLNGNETVTKETVDKELTVSKRFLNGNENGNETVTKETVDKELTVTKRYLNGNESLVSTPSINSFNDNSKTYPLLIGNEKKFVEMVFHQCQLNASLVSPEINIETTKLYLGNLSSPAIKMIIQRVLKKQILYRAERKDGRGGWCKFGMTQNLYNLMMFKQTTIERSLNGNETVSNKSHSKQFSVTKRYLNGNENGNEITSSMYSIVNKNTIHTGTENQNPPEPDSWAELREVDFSALERWNIRNNVIESFKKNKWVVSKEQLEDHIERFARYFTEPEFEVRRSKINSPLGFFLGSIKIIARGEPDPIQDVKTQIELAQEVAMKNRFAEMESRKRQFETFEKQLDQYRESEFEHWLSGLTREQQEQFVAPSKMAQFGSVSYRLLLKSYYTETIWPEFKQTTLNGPRA